MQGFAAKDLPSGTRFLAMHYTADEEKRGMWATEKRKGVPVREWDQQMELREDVWDGEPVFADYSDSLHCPGILRQSPTGQTWAEAIVAGRLDSKWRDYWDKLIVPGSTYYGGWDCGATLSPAFSLTQMAPRNMGYQMITMFEVVPEEGKAMPMETFAPMVQQILMKWHPGLWDIVSHHGDATVDQRSGTRGETAGDVARRHGINIKGETNIEGVRLSAVTRILTRMISERAPGWFLCGVGCPTLRAGFQGAYRFRPHPQSEKNGAGYIPQKPVKDSYSHPQDSFQAAAIAMNRFLKDVKPATVTSRR